MNKSRKILILRGIINTIIYYNPNDTKIDVIEHTVQYLKHWNVKREEVEEVLKIPIQSQFNLYCENFQPSQLIGEEGPPLIRQINERSKN